MVSVLNVIECVSPGEIRIIAALLSHSKWQCDKKEKLQKHDVDDRFLFLCEKKCDDYEVVQQPMV